MHWSKLSELFLLRIFACENDNINRSLGFSIAASLAHSAAELADVPKAQRTLALHNPAWTL